MVKFIAYTNYGPTITISGPVNCETTPYAPAIFTAESDASHGEILNTNTASGFYAATYLNFPTANPNAIDLHDLRICYANNGIYLGGTNTHSLANIQAIGCAYPISAVENTTFVRNYLAHNCTYPFWGYQSTIRAEHVTAHTADRLFSNGGSSALYITNSLAVVMANSSTFTSDSVSVLASDTTVFQTVGAGYHYLSSGSTNRDSGTANISSKMAALLVAGTTYAPTVLSNMFINATVLSTNVARDTLASPDRGYHYPPIDYAFGGLTLTNNSFLTFSDGVCVALHSTAGLTLRSSSYFTSEGTQANLNRIVPYKDCSGPKGPLGQNPGGKGKELIEDFIVFPL